MLHWTSLPAEIRSMILETVAEDYRFRSEHYARAGYASVCQEWQPVFEQWNFRRLVLDQERVSNFEQYMSTKHRRDYLKHVFLRVKLNDYDCTVCRSKEDSATIRYNNDIFSRAFWSLIATLSKWTGLARGHRQRGLTLELGAYSPSDCKHSFRDFHLERNYPYQTGKDLETNCDAYKLRADEFRLDSLHDPYHGWVNGHRDDVSLESKQRIMGIMTIKHNVPEFSTFFQTFPKVEIVTGLLIRRQFYRKIAANSLSKLLRETFTCLKWFRHETWHDVTPQQQLKLENSYKRLITDSLPPTLRELYIFEDFNKILHPERATKRANPSLGRALSKSSLFLENLSAAFLVDAEDFFTNFWPTKAQDSNVMSWENLRKLSLTSRLLHPKIRRVKINKLLVAAGRAAAFMPKLKVMEIWNGGKEHACVFRYNNYGGKSKISWEGNWGYKTPLDQNVIHCWANFSGRGQHSYGNFTTAIDRLPYERKQIKTHATAIRCLKLRHNVLDLISDYQLFCEGQVRYYSTV